MLQTKMMCIEWKTRVTNRLCASCFISIPVIQNYCRGNAVWIWPTLRHTKVDSLVPLTWGKTIDKCVIRHYIAVEHHASTTKSVRSSSISQCPNVACAKYYLSSKKGLIIDITCIKLLLHETGSDCNRRFSTSNTPKRSLAIKPQSFCRFDIKTSMLLLPQEVYNHRDEI